MSIVIVLDFRPPLHGLGGDRRGLGNRPDRKPRGRASRTAEMSLARERACARAAARRRPISDGMPPSYPFHHTKDRESCGDTDTLSRGVYACSAAFGTI